MPEAIQVGEVAYIHNGATKEWHTIVEFKFERVGQEDFHVMSGKSGDHRNNDQFVDICRMSATAIFERQQAAA